MITLEKISKKIPNRTLFDDVCATFNSGARYGLTGPNGAGKSTLMKINYLYEPKRALVFSKRLLTPNIIKEPTPCFCKQFVMLPFTTRKSICDCKSPHSKLTPVRETVI